MPSLFLFLFPLFCVGAVSTLTSKSSSSGSRKLLATCVPSSIALLACRFDLAADFFALAPFFAPFPDFAALGGSTTDMVLSSPWTSVSTTETPSEMVVKFDCVETREAFEARPFFERPALGFAVVERAKNTQSGERRWCSSLSDMSTSTRFRKS